MSSYFPAFSVEVGLNSKEKGEKLRVAKGGKEVLPTSFAKKETF
jgi:hypothetical protein